MVPVPDLARLRVVFARWLAMDGRRDRKIIGAMAVGPSTVAVSARFGVTQGRISQLCLRYERTWVAFQGERLVHPAA
jgi:hypothetical protein